MLESWERCALPAGTLSKRDADGGARGEALPQPRETGQCYWATDTPSPTINAFRYVECHARSFATLNMVACVLFTFKIVYFERFCFRSPFKIGSLRNYSGVFIHTDNTEHLASSLTRH